MARKRDTQDEATSDDIAVDERTAAVEEAAAARIDGPVGVSGPLGEQAPGEPVTGEAPPGGISWEQVNKGVGEELADPEDAEGLEGDPADDLDSVKDGRHSDWSFGGGDGGAGGQNVDGQEFDPGAVPPLNPAAGTAATSPLSADAANARLGRHRGVSGGDEAEDAPTYGKGIIADGEWEFTTETDGTEGDILRNDEQGLTIYQNWDEVGLNYTEVWNERNGTYTRVNHDGSWTSTDKDGNKTSGDALEDPGPDGEGAPIPEDLQAQLDADLARLRAATPHRNPDDGAEDPVEGDPAFSAGQGTQVLDPAAFGKGLIVNPGTAEAGVGGAAPQGNPGADSQGAGVINTENDPTTQGPGDDPFDASEPTIEPFEESDESETESDDDGAESLLSLGQTEIAGPADELPDHIAGPV